MRFSSRRRRRRRRRRQSNQQRECGLYVMIITKHNCRIHIITIYIENELTQFVLSKVQFCLFFVLFLFLSCELLLN